MHELSYLKYLDRLDELHYLKNETDLEDMSRFFSYRQRFQTNPFFFHNYVFYIIDYSKRTHIVMAGRVTEICGFHPRDFFDGGLDFVIDIYHKDDFRTYNTDIFPSTLAFLKEAPHEEHAKYIFEFSYRMRNKKGEIFTAWQKGSYLTDPVTKLPLYGFGVAFDISPMKRDTSMVRVISKCVSDEPEISCRHISTDHYYPYPHEVALSCREIEVLLWMAEGMSSKQIAGRLHLSENTIMNHRKNMLKKTNTKNVAQLISYSFKNRIL